MQEPLSWCSEYEVKMELYSDVTWAWDYLLFVEGMAQGCPVAPLALNALACSTVDLGSLLHPDIEKGTS